ncbi:Replication protein A 70 kDa DNA-binding subunit B [Arachis hypogaea]|uniref:Replication factor A C-terminal domain-containing protein n=1 Tax=Arachis hypogaea TaxID=3818 RepID=A0A445CED2_ARAHY|nr:Replication protein A 70 kDa DNA-binding subunit B [Arachis hypogaea]RYR49213.1 hypothetical protein Ahy_A07g035560 [Arachis hypogaea]
MTTAMDMVNKVNPEKEAWNLKVWVIRLWTVPTFTGQLLPNSMEMILVDESDAICDFIPKSALTISPFTELLETKEDSDFLGDVVGLLVSVSEENEYDKDRRKMKMAVMELAKNDYRIRCALFGEYVNEVNRFLSSWYAEQPVVVLQHAKVKVFRGRVGLQNVMFASRLGFNLNIPEVAAFRKSFISHGVSASQPIGIIGSGKNIGIEEDFMKLTPRCIVKSLDHNSQAGTFVVLAKIAEIVEDGPWWYSACVCGRGVQAESGIYFCQFCNIHVTNVTPRFRVKVLVEDSTGVSIFVLFDREASYLLNKTCAQLFEQHLKDVDSPPIFQEIVGKTMLFKVLIRPVGMEKFKGTYLMRRVCDDAAIVRMFELSGSDLSPEKAEFVPKGEGSFGEPPKVTKSSNLGLTPSSCSELFAGSPQRTQKESSVVDLGADEDAKRKSVDTVMDKLNEVDSFEHSCDEVDESEVEYVVGLNRSSLDAEKDVKPSLKKLRRSLRLQFDEADESRGSGNDGSSRQGLIEVAAHSS